MTDAVHLVTGEFPPDIGGVSDYSASVARGLAAAGTTVHVWCATGREPASFDGVAIHRLRGWSRRELTDVSSAMDRLEPDAPLLVQWVPHAYGRRSLNLEFCRWVRQRGRRGQPVDLMVHEPFLAFREGSWRQDVGAVVHRLMVSLLLSVARRVWVSIPAWADRLRPWTFRRPVPFCWLPVPSNVPVVSDPASAACLRYRLRRDAPLLFGHFGTYSEPTRKALRQLLPAVLASVPQAALVLLGRDSDAFAGELTSIHPGLASRLIAAGVLDPASLSLHLQACDLLLQPYADGVNTRRTAVMAGLAHGIPVVTTFGRDSEPLWRQSGAVALIRPDDIESARCAVRELAADEPLRERLAGAGRALYTAHFALEHTIRALRSGTCPAVRSAPAMAITP